MLKHDPHSGDFGLGFFGHSLESAAYMVNDTELGLLCYLCDFADEPATTEVMGETTSGVQRRGDNSTTADANAMGGPGSNSTRTRATSVRLALRDSYGRALYIEPVSATNLCTKSRQRFHWHLFVGWTTA